MRSSSETDSRNKPLIDRGYWVKYGENFSRNSEMIPSEYDITEKYIYILNSSEGVGIPSIPRPRSCGRDPNSGLPRILCFIRNVLSPLFSISDIDIQILETHHFYYSTFYSIIKPAM